MTRDGALVAALEAGGDVVVGHGRGQVSPRYAKALAMLGEAVVGGGWEARRVRVAPGREVVIPWYVTRLRLTPSGSFTARRVQRGAGHRAVG